MIASAGAGAVHNSQKTVQMLGMAVYQEANAEVMQVQRLSRCSPQCRDISTAQLQTV